jgi:hypothetical protein
MNSELLHQVLDMMEREVRSKPSPSEFEMAYQARVAIDRIRFAIKHAEGFGRHSQQISDASLQLLDALDRLEWAERRFQRRFRAVSANGNSQKLELEETDSKPRANAGGRS